MRAVRAAQLLERGFANNSLSWLRPSLGTVDNLVPIDASPPNLRDEMCSGKRHKPASDEDEDNVASAGGNEPALSFFAGGLQPPTLKPSELLAAAPAPSEPIPVYTGPTRTGEALLAAVAGDAAEQAARHHGKRQRVAAKKPDASVDTKDTEQKPAGKPATVRHANAKPDSASKTADKPDAKPAKPRAAAKPKPDSKTESKPAPKSTTGEAAPAAAAAPRS
jgi:D-alanyl-D-alanine carboxypeptidase